MSQVPISIVKAGLRVSERHGIPRAALLGRPSLEERELTRPMGRVSWDAFCEFNDRIEQAWSTRGGIDRYALAVNEEIPELRAVARMLLNPAQFLRLVISVGTWAHPQMKTSCKTLGPHRLQLGIALADDMRDSPSFFRICGATLATSTRLIGLPPAKVEVEIAPRRAVYRFTLPPSRTVFARGHDLASQTHQMMLDRIAQLQAEVRALLEDQLAGKNSCDRGRLLAQRWSLTTRQAEVLELVAQGWSNRDIATELGCAERTIEVHITELLKKSGKQSRAQLIAQFWGASS